MSDNATPAQQQRIKDTLFVVADDIANRFSGNTALMTVFCHEEDVDGTKGILGFAGNEDLIIASLVRQLENNPHFVILLTKAFRETDIDLVVQMLMENDPPQFDYDDEDDPDF